MNDREWTRAVSEEAQHWFKVGGKPQGYDDVYTRHFAVYVGDRTTPEAHFDTEDEANLAADMLEMIGVRAFVEPEYYL